MIVIVLKSLETKLKGTSKLKGSSFSRSVHNIPVVNSFIETPESYGG